MGRGRAKKEEEVNGRRGREERRRCKEKQKSGRENEKGERG